MSQKYAVSHVQMNLQVIFHSTLGTSEGIQRNHYQTMIFLFGHNKILGYAIFVVHEISYKKKCIKITS